MNVVVKQVDNLRSLADRLRSTAEESRATFTDESRPQFDDRVIEAMRTDIRDIASRVAQLGSALDRAIRLLD